MTLKAVEVVKYNERWPDMFTFEHELLNSVLSPQNVAAIHHIGSTSVVGLHAKPVIDILIEVNSLDMLDGENSNMASIGYVAKGEYGIAGRRYFQKGGEHRTHQAHAFLTGSENALRHLAFRDYLIAFPAVAKEYAALKLQGANICANNIDIYCAHKDSFIKEYEAKALEWMHAGKSE
ncbi:hypothetical protein PA25_14700 [Pseudoalteromonas sp. A25]|uniref:GrpB family protein n=1 Tax=Pseudoalteromonas sp. A25 TaxID=116092 RepID=UPI001260D2E6|nr:GrpB family protein [Pseudoalteromonas sp. A25]BBN81485.1 hypothetical protein PA25_14700 [Pseudoalteromonas sp. A25]